MDPSHQPRTPAGQDNVSRGEESPEHEFCRGLPRGIHRPSFGKLPREQCFQKSGGGSGGAFAVCHGELVQVDGPSCQTFGDLLHEKKVGGSRESEADRSVSPVDGLLDGGQE